MRILPKVISFNNCLRLLRNLSLKEVKTFRPKIRKKMMKMQKIISTTHRKKIISQPQIIYKLYCPPQRRSSLRVSQQLKKFLTKRIMEMVKLLMIQSNFHKMRDSLLKDDTKRLLMPILLVKPQGDGLSKSTRDSYKVR